VVLPVQHLAGILGRLGLAESATENVLNQTMDRLPAFPGFRPLSLGDRDILEDFLRPYQPQTSELTFTNLFIWRTRYGWQWSVDGDRLILLSAKEGAEPFLLPPVGPPPRRERVLKLLRWLRDERSVARPRIERVDPGLAAELRTVSSVRAEPVREHFDYVYRTEELLSLPGSRYHAKRNHISRFMAAAVSEFAPIDESNLRLCAEFHDRWCERRRCAEDLNLLDEWGAVKEALANYGRLGVRGGVFLIEGKVEAFTFGELLNESTVVVHIEKANPEIPGIYAAINQRFLREYWSDVPFVNREQDLGEPGLRKAKLSYHPHHFVEKHRLVLAE
jgi:hypothetical protein